MVICAELSLLIGNTLHGTIFAKTVTFYKGTVWIVSAGILTLPVILSA